MEEISMATIGCDIPMKPFGMVVCGGKSARMGTDKSRLIYHGLPQYAHLANLLSPICNEVLISCNEKQFVSMETSYNKIQDLPELGDHGPIVAVLTFFRTFPNSDLLVVGCDYPFLNAEELTLFLSSVKRDSLAAAFYNRDGKYEPMLAWYSKGSAHLLEAFYQNGEYSLQHFLVATNADKYLPASENSMISVDTPEDFRKISEMLSKRN